MVTIQTADGPIEAPPWDSLSCTSTSTSTSTSTCEWAGDRGTCNTRPLYSRGPFEIVDGDGDLVKTVTRAALCRCGESRNKPFRDNTHRAIGFRAD